MEPVYYKNYTYCIDYDYSPENPRTWSNLFILHGSVHYLDKNDLSNMYILEVKEYLESIYGDDLDSVFVINRYTHGVTSLWSGGKITDWNKINTRPSCRFDSGIGGFAVLLKSSIKECYGINERPTLAILESVLKDELNCLEHWLNGEVYTFTVKDQDGDTVERVGGYYCDIEATEQAKSIIDDLDKKSKVKEIEKDLLPLLLLMNYNNKTL